MFALGWNTTAFASRGSSEQHLCKTAKRNGEKKRALYLPDALETDQNRILPVTFKPSLPVEVGSSDGIADQTALVGKHYSQQGNSGVKWSASFIEML